MSDEASEILALLETTELFLRTQACLYMPFGEALDIGLSAQKRAQALLESVSYAPLPGVPVPGVGPVVAPEPVPTANAALVTEEAERVEYIGDLDAVDAETVDAIDEPEPELDLEAPLDLEVPLEPVAEIAPEPVDEDPDLDVEELEPTSFSALDEVPLGDAELDFADEMEKTEIGGKAADFFPPDFGDEAGSADEISTSPSEIAAQLEAVLDPEDDLDDPVTFGDPDETEDLLQEEADPVIDLGDLGEEDDHTDPGGAIEVNEPGVDALVTIEDTSDPRSDLDGLSHLDDDLGDGAEDDVEEFDLMPDEDDEDPHPDEEETFVADLADIERMKSKMASSQPRAVVPQVAVGGPKAGATARVGPAPPPRVGTGGVASGLYGNPAVPTIRDRNAPKPAAAAIQIDDAQQQASGLGGGGASSLLEEEEVLELGSSEDYGEEEEESFGDGLSLDVQEYEEEEEEEEDDVDLEEIVDDVPLEPIDDSASPEEIRALLKKAEDAVEEGDMEAGIDLYSDVLDNDPDNTRAHVARGRLYLDYGDYSRAMSDFMRAESIEPENPEPQIAVGDLHFARKDYNRAIDFFNEALKMAPNHAMAFCRRGISHYYRKNYAQALADLTKAQKLDEDIPNIRTYIAMAKKKNR